MFPLDSAPPHLFLRLPMKSLRTAAITLLAAPLLFLTSCASSKTAKADCCGKCGKEKPACCGTCSK